MNSFSIISFIGAFQGFLLSIFFFYRSKDRASILMLGLYVFIFSAGLLENWIRDNNHSLAGQILLSMLANSSYLYGPFLYLFINYLTSGVSQFHKRDFAHFLPFLIFFALELIVLLLRYKVSDMFGGLIELIQFEILVIQILTYNVLAIKLLGKHHVTILETYSSIEERDMRWLKILLIIITCVYAFSFLLSHLALFGIQAATKFFIIIQLSITFSIYLMSYMALLRPGLFTFSKISLPTDGIANESPINENQEAILVKDESPLFEKYKRSGLKPEQAEKYLLSLHLLMVNDKPYRDPEINIHRMSQLLVISKNHLTQIVNEQMNMNFFEFINKYRIEEAKKLMLDPGYANLSLQGIAIECGYKSKATFFSNFRKITGQTPQEWIKSQQSPV